MASIAYALDRIKRDPLNLLDRRTIEQICREHHHHWRERQLDPAATVALFIQQILHGNVPCTEVRHLAPGTPGFTAQAYCDARAWLPLGVYHDLFSSLCDALFPQLRRTVCRPGLGHVTLTMVTTLLDPVKYPASDLLELRLRRWDVETNLAHLKTTMGLDVLHCKTETGVRKELAVFCLAYNLVRAVMLEASRRQEVPVRRIRFANTLKWLWHARPGDRLPDLVVNRHRPDRIEPRCRKRRPKEYDLMTKPRNVLRTRLQKQAKRA